MTILLLCTLRSIGVSSVMEELLPFDCRNVINCFRPQTIIGNQGIEFHVTLLNIYEHVVAMHVKFYQVVSHGGVIAL